MKKSLLAILGLTVASAAIAATPIHHYNFSGSTVTDLIGSANGTLLNGAYVANGMLHLDGSDDYVQFGQNLIPTSGAFSVAFFARELSPAVPSRMEMISQGASYGPGFYIGYYGDDRQIRVGDQWQATGVEFPGDGDWHHFAVTVDASAARLYLDGVIVASRAPIAVANVGNFTRLGRQFNYLQEPTFGPEMFHGNLADLWVFSGALTETEVAALAVVPEPSAVTLVIAGILALLGWRRTAKAR